MPYRSLIFSDLEKIDFLTRRSGNQLFTEDRGATPVDIAYSVRSKFLGACEAAVRAGRAELEAGRVVHVDLGEGGYDNRIVVTIRNDDSASFGTDWESTDPSRFPVRIKAAATALLNCGFVGQYELWHADGSLSIRAA